LGRETISGLAHIVSAFASQNRVVLDRIWDRVRVRDTFGG
jgi:hypothetical protein